MKREFIVSKIEASQDDKSPFVYITFSDPKNPRNGKQQQSQFDRMGMGFTFPEDLMKNFQKILGSGRGIGPDDSPTFKLSIREYEESRLKVGDRVRIEVKKSNSTGI